MIERRRHRERWAPGAGSPGDLSERLGNLIIVVVAILVTALLSTCAQAGEATPTEQKAYRAGIVVGTYWSFVGGIVQRLIAGGVPEQEIPGVLARGCGGVTIPLLVGAVLEEPPIPERDVHVMLQTRQILRRVCASFKEEQT